MCDTGFVTGGPEDTRLDEDGAPPGPNNGLRLRGVTVLRSSEERSYPVLPNVASLLVGQMPDVERNWFVLTVVDDESGGFLATRRFKRRGAREEAHQVLETAIRSMDDDELKSVRWQALVDAV